MTSILCAFVVLATLAACTAPGGPSASAGTTAATGPAASAASGTVSATPPIPATPTVEPVASTASIPDSALPRVRFVPASGAAITLPIEVPPESEYGIGLSGRKTLAERGMLFYFPQVANIDFWMLDTHIDLDIAFISKDLKVLSVQTMKADTLDRHNPGTPYLASIEAPAGWYAAHGVKAGDTVVFDFDLKQVTGR